MLLHYLVGGKPAIIVHFLAESDYVCWVYLFLILLVAELSHSFESLRIWLRIWIGHMKLP